MCRHGIGMNQTLYYTMTMYEILTYLTYWDTV